jgi:sugar phosphate isomerase/epimerase
MKTWQIGCYTRPWGAYDYRVAFDAVAEAGFKYVGLMSADSLTKLVLTPANTAEESLQIGEEAKKRQLGIISTYGGGPPVAKSLQAGIDWLRKLVDNCALAGSPSILLAGTGNPSLEKYYFQAIGECCDYAAGKQVQLILKPHGPLNATGRLCRQWVEKVNHPNFQMWYDPGNVAIYSDGTIDPALDAETVAGFVTGMCVKDYQQVPKTVNITPGTGQVDFAAVLAHLRGDPPGGFTHGPLVVETLARGTQGELIQEARKAREFLEELTGKNQ